MSVADVLIRLRSLVRIQNGPPLFLSQTNNYLLENDLLFCQHDIRRTNPLNVPAFDGIIAFKYTR